MTPAQPSAIDLKFEISDGVSKAIEAVARLVEQGMVIGHERYKEMDDDHKKRLDEVLVRTSERGNEFLEACHRLIFKGHEFPNKDWRRREVAKAENLAGDCRGGRRQSDRWTPRCPGRA